MKGKFLSDYADDEDKSAGDGASEVTIEAEPSPSGDGDIKRLAEKAVNGDPMALIKLITRICEG